MSPFEALYGRKCRISANWDGPFNKVIVGLDMLIQMEQQVVQIRQKLKASQDKKKSYVDMKRTPKEFKVGDHV